MVVLLNALKDGKGRVVAKDWLVENGSKIKDKHIFYIVRPRDICDVLNFKLGKSHSGFNRIKQYSNLYCNDVWIYYIQTFNKRGDGLSGEQPVDYFEKSYIRNLKKMKIPFVRGNEFVRCSGRKMEQALDLTYDMGDPIHTPLRTIPERKQHEKPWWKRF